MKIYEGKWKCDGKALDMPPFQKAHPVKAEITTKKDLNGYWYAMRYEEKKSKDNPKPFVFAGFVGFDPSKKQLVRTDIDGMGMLTHLSSKGWEGDKIQWAGEVMGMKMQFRETTTKKSDKQLATVLEMAGPDGKWGTLMEMSCKK
jgi:hypothetical protein